MNALEEHRQLIEKLEQARMSRKVRPVPPPSRQFKWKYNPPRTAAPPTPARSRFGRVPGLGAAPMRWRTALTLSGATLIPIMLLISAAGGGNAARTGESEHRLNGERLLREGRFEEALTEFGTGAREQPDAEFYTWALGWTHYNLAREYRQRDPDEAARHSRASREYAGTWIADEAVGVRMKDLNARLALDKGDLARAAALFGEIVEFDPKSPLADTARKNLAALKAASRVRRP